jgi:multidrug efflux pump subunit AcrA (membrane-fusion protein)
MEVAQCHAAASSSVPAARNHQRAHSAEDGTEYAQAGRLLFSGPDGLLRTGQITPACWKLPNAQGRLLARPVRRVRLEQARASNAITLPQRKAVTRTNQGDSVMVVGSDGKVSQGPSIRFCQRVPHGWCSTA